MYRSIVRRRVASLFAEINRGNWQAVVDALSDKFVYRFVGDTPLGGTRTVKASMQEWFKRIFRLVPDAQLHPQMIVVEGAPWNTRVMTYVKFKGTLPGSKGAKGEPYENEVMQLMHIKWGRIISVLTIEDTQRFVNILPVLAAAGISEANAAPITDLPMTRISTVGQKSGSSSSHTDYPKPYTPSESARRPA
jgi:ketosteroid isomerase-like protein